MKRRWAKKMKKTIVIGVVLICMIGGASVGFAANKQFAGTKLYFLAAAEDEAYYRRDVIGPMFEKKTGIKVIFDTVPYERLYEKEVLELQSSRYDIYGVDQMWVRSFSRSGFLATLDQFVDKYGTNLSNYFPNIVEIGNLGGVQYSFPLSAIPVIYMYRGDWMKEAGITKPDTYTEVLETAKKLTKDFDGDGVMDRWGWATRGTRGNPITWTYLPMLWSFGGKIFDDNMKPVYNSKEAVDAVKYFKELNRYSPPGWHTGYETTQFLAQNKAAQTVMMMVLAPMLDDPERSKVVGKVDFSRVPKQEIRRAILGLWTIGVSANSKNKEAAYLFLDYISQPEIAKMMGFHAHGPTMPFIYTDPEAPRYYKAAGESLEVALPPPLIPEAEAWFVSIGSALQQALSGEFTPQQAMDESVKYIYDLLKEAGYY